MGEEVKYHIPIPVRIRRKGGVVVQDCDVYCGRRMTQGGWKLSESPWANPFKAVNGDNQTAVNNYEVYIREEIQKNPGLWWERLEPIISAGRPVTLGCWCKTTPDIPCHTDVIAKICRETIELILGSKLNGV